MQNTNKDIRAEITSVARKSSASLLKMFYTEKYCRNAQRNKAPVSQTCTM